MGGRLSPIAKGRLLKLVDQNLEKPVQAFLDELTSGTSMVDLGLDKHILNTTQVGHVEDEIFGDAGNAKAWWPSEAEKQEIVRGGFIQALKVALGHTPPVSIQCYWVCCVDHFEIIVADCPDQVNVFLLTPAPAKPLSPPANGSVEDMWVVATETRCQELFAAIPLNYGAVPPQDIASVAGVKVLRLFGY